MPPQPSAFDNCLVLTGPTGAGKSALALALAESIDAEIVALDSMTLYRGMDIGTAKPTPAERARVPHHLLDVLDPWESASVAWYLDQAARRVADIHSRGRRALFVGGTPFYLKALCHGLFESPTVDLALRSALEAEAAAMGPNALHARLVAIDPVSAGRLHPNDVKRVVRALEVHQLTGQPLSAQQQQWSPNSRGPENLRLLCVELPRDELYWRIDRRVEAMIAAGWLDEVARLLALPQPLSREASQALGYPELAAVLAGKVALAEAVVTIQTRTRQFAKRQLTWFRSFSGLIRVAPDLTLLRLAAKIECGERGASLPNTPARDAQGSE